MSALPRLPVGVRSAQTTVTDAVNGHAMQLGLYSITCYRLTLPNDTDMYVLTEHGEIIYEAGEGESPRVWAELERIRKKRDEQNNQVFGGSYEDPLAED